MYDFLLSETWWMETIIASLIAALATIVSSWLVYAKTINNMKRDIEILLENNKSILSELSNGHSKLSDGHSKLSDGYSKLSDEHSKLSDEHHSLDLSANIIKDGLSRTENNIDKLVEYMNIRKGENTDLKDVCQYLDKIESAISREVSNKIDWNIKLTAMDVKIKELVQQKDTLSKENTQLKEQNRKLMNKIQSLENKRDYNKKDDYEIDI